MSLLPYIFDDFHFGGPRRLMDQHFVLGLTPDDFLTAAAGRLLSREYYRPWRNLVTATRDQGSSIMANPDYYQVSLDVQNFAPDEISVKTVDGFVVVEAKHEEKEDQHGHVSRHFVRRYSLPEGTLPETVESKLSSDGVLTVSVPRKVPEPVEGVRNVPIIQTGPVRKDIKDQNEGTNEKQE